MKWILVFPIWAIIFLPLIWLTPSGLFSDIVMSFLFLSWIGSIWISALCFAIIVDSIYISLVKGELIDSIKKGNK